MLMLTRNCAVAIYLNGNVVGHLPKNSMALQHGGTISYIVTGQRKYSDVPNKGLELPCIYTFKVKPALIKRMIKLVTGIKI